MTIQRVAPPSPSLGQWMYLLWAGLADLITETIRQETNATVTSNAAMDDTSGTYVVTSSGLTLTLPAASVARIGKRWVVNFSTTGTLTIQRAGSDTIMTPTSAADTSVTVTIRGTSLDFECNSASTWIIV